jgi:cytochrome c
MSPRVRLGAMALAVATAFGLPLVHPFGNPRAASKGNRETLLVGSSMPEDARRVLVNKCADCHSEATHWPVYSRAAPVSWLVERDVTRGREHLNFSHWQDLTPAQRETLSVEITQQVKKGHMPPLRYELVHRNARLNSVDLADLARLNPGSTEQESAPQSGDATRGQATFERKCTGCHSLDENHEGPRLRNVYGRKSGSIAGFDYSDDMRKAGLVWTEANLNRWLSDSDAMLPQSKMGFSVPKAQDRADIIAFLRSQANSSLNLR